MEIEPYIMRRAKFILDEARLDDRKKDQTIIYAMRVISNYGVTGKDTSSSGLKMQNRRMTVGAYERLKELAQNNSFGVAKKVWCSGTISEHPLPYKLYWLQVCERAQNITAQDIINEIFGVPVETVLKTEDQALTGKGLRSSGTINERRQHLKFIDCEHAPVKLLRDWTSHKTTFSVG